MTPRTAHRRTTTTRMSYDDAVSDDLADQLLAQKELLQARIATIDALLTTLNHDSPENVLVSSEAATAEEDEPPEHDIKAETTPIEAVEEEEEIEDDEAAEPVPTIEGKHDDDADEKEEIDGPAFEEPDIKAETAIEDFGVEKEEAPESAAIVKGKSMEERIQEMNEQDFRDMLATLQESMNQKEGNYLWELQSAPEHKPSPQPVVDDTVKKYGVKSTDIKEIGDVIGSIIFVEKQIRHENILDIKEREGPRKKKKLAIEPLPSQLC